MARKITFSFPQDVARELLKRIPARSRSHFVAEAVMDKLREHEQQLIRACKIANQDPDVLAIEQEWEALSDGTRHSGF